MMATPTEQPAEPRGPAVTVVWPQSSLPPVVEPPVVEPPVEVNYDEGDIWRYQDGEWVAVPTEWLEVYVCVDGTPTLKKMLALVE